jgi:divalent metal cation (Fe/Co/Zn/Cd) transporter
MTITRENFEIQKKLTAIVLIIFFIKILAWYFTNSVAILTDTLENILSM